MLQANAVELDIQMPLQAQEQASAQKGVMAVYIFVFKGSNEELRTSPPAPGTPEMVRMEEEH